MNVEMGRRLYLGSVQRGRIVQRDRVINITIDVLKMT